LWDTDSEFLFEFGEWKTAELAAEEMIAEAQSDKTGRSDTSNAR